MGIISWIVVGGLAGWLASIIMGTNNSMGVGANVIVGIVGALIGGWLIAIFGGGQSFTGFNISSFLVALLGSVILLGIVRTFRRSPVQ